MATPAEFAADGRNAFLPRACNARARASRKRNGWNAEAAGEGRSKPNEPVFEGVSHWNTLISEQLAFSENHQNARKPPKIVADEPESPLIPRRADAWWRSAKVGIVSVTPAPKTISSYDSLAE